MGGYHSVKLVNTVPLVPCILTRISILFAHWYGVYGHSFYPSTFLALNIAVAGFFFLLHGKHPLMEYIHGYWSGSYCYLFRMEVCMYRHE
jgi:hypothetical protein